MERYWLIGSILVGLVPTTAQADIFTLKGGGQIEGKIESETPTTYNLIVRRQNLRASLAVLKTNVLSIKRQAKTGFERLQESYRRREQHAVRARDPLAWESLASWCQTRKLNREHRFALASALMLRRLDTVKLGTAEAWPPPAPGGRGKNIAGGTPTSEEEALRKDPNHLAARRALGFRRHGGAWLTREQYRETLDREMRLKGYVRYQGKWYTAEAATALAKLKELAIRRRLQQLELKLAHLTGRLERQEKSTLALARHLSALEKAHTEALKAHALAAERELRALERRIHLLEVSLAHR